MKPTIGRIVTYCLRTDEIGPFTNNTAFLPAIIVRVWSDSCVNLKVINDGMADFWKTSVSLDKKDEQPQTPGTWRWPERVQ